MTSRQDAETHDGPRATVTGDRAAWPRGVDERCERCGQPLTASQSRTTPRGRLVCLDCWEEAIPLADIAQYLPRHDGKKRNYSTLWRWASNGVRGQRLRSWYVVGRRYTSLAAVDEFIIFLNVEAGKPIDGPGMRPRSRPQPRPHRQGRAAVEYLKREGFTVGHPSANPKGQAS